MDGIAELVKVLRERTWLSPVSAEEMNHRDRWLADQIEQSAPAAHQERTEPMPQEIIEHRLRQELWLNHGCRFYELYGDDGEMQCHARDFKRAPLAELIEHVDELRLARVGKAIREVGAPARAAEWQPLTKEDEDDPTPRHDRR